MIIRNGSSVWLINCLKNDILRYKRMKDFEKHAELNDGEKKEQEEAASFREIFHRFNNGIPQYQKSMFFEK